MNSRKRSLYRSRIAGLFCVCAAVFTTELVGCGTDDSHVLPDGGTDNSHVPDGGVTVIAPAKLGYARNPANYRLGAAIEHNVPYFEGGAPTQYSIRPSLPAGLTLDASTGVLSGTPTALTPTTEYSVTARNSAGSTQTTLTLKIASTTPVVTNAGVYALVETAARFIWAATLHTSVPLPVLE